MIDLELVKIAANYATKALREIVHANVKTQAQWKAAVSTLQKAVLKTETYVSSLERGKPVSRAAEEQFVDLWRDASNGFYTLDGALAARLQLKAEYWTGPQAWTSQQVRDAGIALQQVAEYTRQLLHES